jgi:hypothetical protein
MLNVLMTQPILNQSRVTAPICQSKPAAVPQLVKVDGKLKTRDLTQFGDNHVCPSGSQWGSQPGKKQPRRLTDLSLESSQ